MNAVITTDIENINNLKKQLAEIPNMKGMELASKVSTKEPYYFGDENATFKIAALDIGIKKNILNKFYLKFKRYNRYIISYYIV